MYKTVISEI